MLWRHRRGQWELNERGIIMGILNVTPDSFSDGGLYFSLEAAERRAAELEAQGAELLDVGGESTRPGADPVEVEEELRRVIPVIRAIRRRSTIPLSIDTSKAEVAEEALRAGADVVNDVTGFAGDERMAEVAVAHQAGAVVMHMRGRPRTMQQAP
ncbi:MAG: dihydropteroate synthase, partial [Terrimicrobiaceae bacterium]|nr:dihydropteroate synthase [Terrimicrobiaceae bacterium]